MSMGSASSGVCSSWEIHGMLSKKAGPGRGDMGHSVRRQWRRRGDRTALKAMFRRLLLIGLHSVADLVTCDRVRKQNASTRARSYLRPVGTGIEEINGGGESWGAEEPSLRENAL